MSDIDLANSFVGRMTLTPRIDGAAAPDLPALIRAIGDAHRMPKGKARKQAMDKAVRAAMDAVGE